MIQAVKGEKHLVSPDPFPLVFELVNQGVSLQKQVSLPLTNIRVEMGVLSSS